MPVVLYERQRQIIDFIAQYIQKNGFAPSLKSIAKAMNLSSLATVHEHIEILARKGVIKKTGTRKNRVLEIVDKKLANQDQGIRLPILGFIAAGKPIEPFSDPNAFLHVAPAMMTGKKRAYVLQVRGSSMIEEGIFDGDYVVVEERHDVKNGDIVVALLETGLATLKRFFKEATRVRLEPANAKMAPIFATKVQIQGRVVAVIRKY
ncbi:transcriptional repressor LexA [Patescibacteria group bacterium]